MTETWEHFYQSLDITPILLLGPNTPWPNRAESAVRLLKAQLKIMLHSIKSGNAPATLKKVTHRQLVKAAATVRNQTVTHEGVTPLELAIGRRPADLIQLDVATPTQLTIDRNEEELTAIQIKQLSKHIPRGSSIREHPKRPCSELQDELQTSSVEEQGILLAGRQIQDSFRWK